MYWSGGEHEHLGGCVDTTAMSLSAMSVLAVDMGHRKDVASGDSGAAGAAAVVVGGQKNRVRLKCLVFLSKETFPRRGVCGAGTWG